MASLTALSRDSEDLVGNDPGDLAEVQGELKALMLALAHIVITPHVCEYYK
jgi:hypothetical protein